MTATLLEESRAPVAHPPMLMTCREAADFLSLSEEQLFLWRRDRKGPPFLHIGARTIRYDRDDLLAWARSHRVLTAA